MHPAAIAAAAIPAALVAATSHWSTQPQSPNRPNRSTGLQRANTLPSSSATARMATSTRFDESRRAELKRIADDTIQALRDGYYPHKGIDHDLGSTMKDAKKNTKYFSPEAAISKWASTKAPKPPSGSGLTHISVLHISTLDAARLLEGVYSTTGKRGKTGVLNFASATKPGGGFRSGAEAQEESIARSSTLYCSLMTDEARQFYRLHEQQQQSSTAFYSHAIVYSSSITIFRGDDGAWTYPFSIDVLSCAAVNAGELRKQYNGPVPPGFEVIIEKEMTERMGRLLFVFEQQGVRNIVLGTFGTGVFRNDVATVARIWARHLLLPESRFKDSFDRIIFAVTGDGTFSDFQSAFEAWAQPRPTASSSTRTGRGVLTARLW